jgi:hypothetical protein
MAQDPQMINVCCYQMTSVYEMQNTFFDEKKRVDVDIIKNNNSNLYFIKGMHYSIRIFS